MQVETQYSASKAILIHTGEGDIYMVLNFITIVVNSTIALVILIVYVIYYMYLIISCGIKI